MTVGSTPALRIRASVFRDVPHPGGGGALASYGRRLVLGGISLVLTEQRRCYSESKQSDLAALVCLFCREPPRRPGINEPQQLCAVDRLNEMDLKTSRGAAQMIVSEAITSQCDESRYRWVICADSPGNLVPIQHG